MRNPFVRSTLPGMLAGLLLMACGGSAETEATPAEDTLGTATGALCAGTSVTGLGISSVSSSGGTLSASGSWSVGGGANAAKLEYWVDGVLRSYDERLGTSGSWVASAGSIACGSHTLEVRAYPMVVDSAGNRTYCTSNGPVATSQGFTQTCPSASLSCTRTSTSIITCTGSGSGGSGPYTPLWNQDIIFPDDSTYQSGFFAGAFTESFYCRQPTVRAPTKWLQIQFKVRDATGVESSLRFSHDYGCGP
jgi:hypothetical protein